ncbi:arginine exporter ArgO [Musicola keenii]|uniref:arginine exporter ArgO n=1 Tax=Musicola keenii TaxID=2884250 RepID=UPI00177E5ABB|nr:arginine exporter ArgO [Musicola keenii]
MTMIYWQGFFLGAAMILPLGPQNMFVMNQGIRRHYHLTIALICSLSDMALICAGVFGGSALLTQSVLLMMLVTWGGVAFLLWYGWGAIRIACQRDIQLNDAKISRESRWRIMLTLLAVTWLNPHVYLDTFVVLGSLGGRLETGERSWFALGSITASFVWFFGLAVLASWFAPWLRSVRCQRVINLFVGAVMWSMALQLAHDGWQHL